MHCYWGNDLPLPCLDFKQCEVFAQVQEKPSGCSAIAWGLHRDHHNMPRARPATGVFWSTLTDTAVSGARWLLAKTCRSQYLGLTLPTYFPGSREI